MIWLILIWNVILTYMVFKMDVKATDAFNNTNESLKALQRQITDRQEQGAARANDVREEPGDDIFQKAVEAVFKAGKASPSMLQRRYRIGYARAARLMDLMEERGIIGAADGARPRDLLISSLDQVDKSQHE